MSEEVNSASVNVGPGDKIAGYRLEEQVGQGGMAVVYRARDDRLDRQVALKVLAPALTADPGFRARFIRESRAAASVDHRHILPVYDTGDADGVLFIAMRYIPGGDVRRLFADGQVMPPTRVWSIVSQVADALDAAHAHNLIHRDVKPANMLIEAPAQLSGARSDHVYLTDFGVSMQGVTSHLTSTGHFVGSLAYIAPEQIEAREIRGYADQYSLACATYEMFTGKPPFVGDYAVLLINAQLTMPPPPVSARRPELPAAVDLVLAKALAKSPDQRYPTCSDFTDDLGKALGIGAGTPAISTNPHATTTSANAGQPSLPPPPTEITNPAQVPLPITTGPGQYSPSVGYGSVMPTPPPQWAGPAPIPSPPQWAGPAPIPSPPQWAGPAPMPPPPPRKDRAPLIAALAAVIVVVLAAAGTVAYVATKPTAQLASPSTSTSISASPASTPTQTQTQTPTTPPTTAPTDSEATEVSAINDLLTNSSISRTALSTAVSDVGSCLNVADDVTQINQILTERESQLSDAQSLQVEAIPNGTQVQSSLVAALMASITADQDYLSWAEEENGDNCADGTNSQYYQAALNDDTTATDDKNAFYGVWGQPADQYGYNSTPYF